MIKLTLSVFRFKTIILTILTNFFGHDVRHSNWERIYTINTIRLYYTIRLIRSYVAQNSSPGTAILCKPRARVTIVRRRSNSNHSRVLAFAVSNVPKHNSLENDRCVKYLRKTKDCSRIETVWRKRSCLARGGILARIIAAVVSYLSVSRNVFGFKTKLQLQTYVLPFQTNMYRWQTYKQTHRRLRFRWCIVTVLFRLIACNNKHICTHARTNNRNCAPRVVFFIRIFPNRPPVTCANQIWPIWRRLAVHRPRRGKISRVYVV